MNELDRGNLFAAMPQGFDDEVFEELASAESVRIERILSRGHASPADSWYDQDEHEWVAVLQGEATLEFEDGQQFRLGVGEYVLIPAHVRHRVAWTEPDRVTVWLAVFYTDKQRAVEDSDDVS